EPAEGLVRPDAAVVEGEARDGCRGLRLVRRDARISRTRKRPAFDAGARRAAARLEKRPLAARAARLGGRILRLVPLRPPDAAYARPRRADRLGQDLEADRRVAERGRGSGESAAAQRGAPARRLFDVGGRTEAALRRRADPAALARGSDVVAARGGASRSLSRFGPGHGALRRT